MQIIVYENPDQSGMLVFCYPTGEIPIEEVLIKDCPTGAFIVEEDTLPTKIDKFLDALRLNGQEIYLDMTAAKAVQNVYLNNICRQESTHRADNDGIGIPNVLDQTQWLALINSARASISTSTDILQLQEAIVPVEAAIIANI